MPAFEIPFDKILAVNPPLQFWDHPVEPLRELRRVLRSGGRIAIAFRALAAPGLTTRQRGREARKIATALRDAGFSQVRLETLKLKPAVVCALGVNASGGDPPHRGEP